MIYIESKSNDPRYNTALELYAFNELAKNGIIRSKEIVNY